MERYTDRDERPWYRQRAFDTAMSAMDALYEFMRRSEYVDPALRNQVRERLVTSSVPKALLAQSPAQHMGIAPEE